MLEEIHLEQSGGGNGGAANNSEFVGQMEQVFRAIDKQASGVITLANLRSEIQELGADIDDNPLIGQLISYLKVVHSSRDDQEDDENAIYIDFEAFVVSISAFVEGADVQATRQAREARDKLPKFRVPADLLKRYNITPRGSPALPGAGSGYSHTANFSSPSKNNKFGKMYSAKPVVAFDEFERLVAKLNNDHEIPRNKLLLFVGDLPADSDGCIEATTFLSRYGGLNHPLSPKITFEETDIVAKTETEERSTLAWNKNANIVEKLQESYRHLEKECDTFQSEISFLEKSKQQLEAQLKKREMEVERLKKESKFVEGMRDTNKELVVQNSNLKTQISKLNNNESSLRDNIESEKDRMRAVKEAMVLKDLEIKKLNHLLKTQQNINNKLSMMVTFSNDVGDKNDLSKANTARRIKSPTATERSKPAFIKQKSEALFEQPRGMPLSPRSSDILDRSLELDRSFDASMIADPQEQDAGESLQNEFEQLKQVAAEHGGSELELLKEQLEMFGDVTLPTPEESPMCHPQENPDQNSAVVLGHEQQQPSPSQPPQQPTTPRGQSTTPKLETIKEVKEEISNTSSGPLPITMSPASISTKSPIAAQPSSPLRLSSPYNTVSSPRSLNSPSYVRQSSPTFFDRAAATTTSPTTSSSSNPVTSANSCPTLSPLDLSTSGSVKANGGSLKRMKKSDLLRLQTMELEAHKESAQNLIDETTAALSDLYRNKDVELQRIQKMYQEEKQSNKFLEKQLSMQLDKNKELNAGKEKNSWGGMQGFFSFVSYFVPSNLFCNTATGGTS
eukprot:gene7645-8946_t